MVLVRNPIPSCELEGLDASEEGNQQVPTAELQHSQAKTLDFGGFLYTMWVPTSGWFTLENPMKMDDLGVSLF